MGKRIGWIVAVVLVVGLVAGFAARAMAGDNGSTGKPSRTITVSSTAVVQTRPDEAVIDLGVQSESASSAQAFARNAQDMQAVLGALQTAGIKRTDIKTLNVSLERQQAGRGSARHHVFVASNQVQVTIRNLQAVGSVIDAGVRAGADSVQDVRFQLSNLNAVRTDTLAQAVKGARTKADALAAAAGAKVLRVVTIDEQGFRSPVYRSAVFAPQLALARPTPVVPPSFLQASVTVQVVWEIA